MKDEIDIFGFRLNSGRKILKPVWFEHTYCGLALGYAKDHRTRDSFVRCLLCKQDVGIASRGITTFWEHCRVVRHHRLDCLVCSRRGLALRKRDGTLMSESEAAAFTATLIGESVPQIEVCPDVTVIEALRIEAEGRSVWSDGSDVSEDRQVESVRLFLCLVVDAMYRDCEFSSVLHLWDLIVASCRQHSSLFGATCRESDVLVIIVYLYVLHVRMHVTCRYVHGKLSIVIVEENSYILGFDLNAF